VNKYRLLILLPTIFLYGCDAVVDKFYDTYETPYKAAYKESFIRSCTEHDSSEQAKAICSCMVDDLLTNYPASELNDQDRIRKRIQEVLIKQCKESQSD